MKKEILFITLIFTIYSCSSKKTDQSSDSIGKYRSFEQVFNTIDSLLKIDNGKFWNHQLYGPILLVDKESRELVANQNNKLNEFKKIGNVYVDTLPNNINIANTAKKWKDERWTMLILPLPENKSDLNNLLIHELFHRIQPYIGFEELYEQKNSYLDTYEGRVLLKLELEALKSCINTTDTNFHELHLSNAITFRTIRQSDEQKRKAENSLELNEGMAEYTGALLSDRTDRELKQHFINRINQFYKNETFVRSFAYQTIPIYGYLLSRNNQNWHQEVTRETNLTDYFVNNLSVDIPKDKPFELIAQSYDYNYKQIIEEEKKRENLRVDKIKNYKKQFLTEPTLSLSFVNMNVSFDPSNITPLDNIGTVYPNLRITDNWGVLSVEKGALIKADWSGVIVSQPTNVTAKKVEGDGWVLELEDSWQVKNQNGNFTLTKK